MGELPSWLNNSKDKLKKQNRRSNRQERARAREVGGRVQAGSGSSWRAAGDVKTEDFLEEMKWTDNKSYGLKVSEWNAIKRKAQSQGRQPRLVIEFPQEGLRLIVEEG
jgi:hypothetical protein